MLTKRITQVFTDAGFQTNEARQGRQRKAVIFGAHSLRHHFVTAATEVGFPAKMIRTITGHATDEMLGHYQQIGKELATELAARIGSTPKQLMAQVTKPTEFGGGQCAPRKRIRPEQGEAKSKWLKDHIRILAAELTADTWKAVKQKLEALDAEIPESTE